MSNKIRFTKMHGCGNDYIYVNEMEYHVADPVAAAVKLSDRHKGIGSDGLVLIDKSPVPEADFSMRIFNADGSEAMMCGNASRCIGKFLYERGLTTNTEIRLLTLSGIKTLQLHITNGRVSSVTVDMLQPVLEDEKQFVAALSQGNGTFVSMGNPHYVIFTDNVELGAYNIEIHTNADHHTHGTQSTDCDGDADHDHAADHDHDGDHEHDHDGNAWVYNQDFTIPAGQVRFEARHDIAIPDSIEPGDYHFMIRLTDRAGWQQLRAVGIKITE